ncbi:MAG: bifunctional riboflavin kinase/FAD synthetase [Candidatus Acidiferrales bacterium]
MPFAKIHSAGDWTARFGTGGETAAVTIGNFDGVHLGHQKILRDTCELAARMRAMAVVLTFYPHPARILRPAQAPLLLMTLDQRLAAIEKLNLHAALVLPFDETLAKMSAEDFVRKFLKETIEASAVVIGNNFRFGRGQQGDAKFLDMMGLDVYPSPPVEVDGVPVSSSAIRLAVAEGRVEDAARMLGRPFSLAGEIVAGTGQGRKLIVPTLNLGTQQELLPKLGVYATETIVGGETYRSATNVGTRPTFDGQRLAIESHLLDFSGELTNGEMEVRFLKRLRDEQKFSSPEELRAQVLRDIEQAHEFFRISNAGNFGA